MKPFDLERALAGDPIVTRDGKEALDFAYFPNIKNEAEEKIRVVIDGGIFSYFTNGKYYSYKESSSDLFMAGTKKEGWINIYSNISYYGIWKTKEEAENISNSDFNYITTIKIEWEE